MAPDFSVGCLTFRSGVVARLTCGLAAPRDRSMTVLGEAKTLVIRDLWDNRSPINLSANDQRSFLQKVANKIENWRGRALPLRLHGGKRVAYGRQSRGATLPAYPSQIDFAQGIQAQAEAIAVSQQPFFSGRTALHLTEVALSLHAGLRDHEVKNSFDPAQ